VPVACVAGGGGINPGTGTSVLTFDEATPPLLTDFGGETSSLVVDPAGGSNKVLKVVKPVAANLWAGTTVSTAANQAIATLAFSATATKLTLRAYSPAVGVHVRLKVEDAANGGHSVETEAITTVAGAWELLTFDFSAPASGTAGINLAYTYNKASVFPDFGKGSDAAGNPMPADRTYYFDDLTFLGGAATAGGGGGGTGTLSGGIYAAEYTGDLDPTKNLPPRTTLGGDIGFFYDARLAATKAYDFGGISGPAQNPGGVNNFYYGMGLKPPAITDAYFGAYVNSPANGQTDVSAYANLNVTFWGPAELFEKSFTPAIQVVMAGPTVAGCMSNSGRSEIQKIIPAAQKIGAASNYVLPLSGFTLKFACSGETTVAQVLAKLAQINFTLTGTNIQYSVPDTSVPVAYPIGFNIGPIKFN
jgi:hypothetical protein